MPAAARQFAHRRQMRAPRCALTALFLAEVALAGSSTGQPPPTVVRSTATEHLAAAQELSRAAKTEDDFALVIEQCRHAARRSPKQGQAARHARRLQAWALHARARIRRDAGRADEALADFDAAARLDPRHAKATLGAAQVRYELGRCREAVRDFGRTLELDGDCVPALVGRGHAHYRLKEMAAAIADYSAAIQRNGNDASTYTQRGNAHADLGHYTEAAEDYRSAMRIDPNYGRAFQAAAWLMATCPDARYREPNLAIQLARRAIELDGDSHYRYLETLAAALANAGRYREARAAQKQALARAPRSAISSAESRLELFTVQRPYRDGRLPR